MTQLSASTEKSNQIIKAAVKRFARHGLSKTTLDEIARDLRIGKATIYHYFKSKQELFDRTLIWEIDLFLEKIKNIFNDEEVPIKQRFLNYFLFKEKLQVDYKFLYDQINSVLQLEEDGQDAGALKILFPREEEILKLALSSLYTGRIESMNINLPSFVVMMSWGFLFGGKLRTMSNPAGEIQSSELLSSLFILITR